MKHTNVIIYLIGYDDCTKVEDDGIQSDGK